MRRRDPFIGLVLLAAGVASAQSGDATNSTIKILADSRERFTASGLLRVDQVNGDNHLFAILPVPGTNWEFNLWVEGKWVDGGIDDLNIAILGSHLNGPHDEDDDPNPLDLIDIGSTPGGTVDLAFADWAKSKWVSVSTTIVHPAGTKKHNDWYGVRWKPSALKGPPPLVAGACTIASKHWGPGEQNFGEWFTSQFETYGATEKSGSSSSYDPDTRTLTLVMGATDIADREGGRSLAVDPRFAEDPILGVEPVTIQLPLLDFDPQTGEYIFGPGEFSAANPETALRIGGTIAELRVSSTLPGERLGAFGLFQPIAVIDTAEPEESPSLWADGFVRTGWFGDGRSDEEWMQAVSPVLTFSTPIDLVEATNGFTQPALLPATIMLTIAARPACPADFNGDGQINTLDVLSFLNAWNAGCD
jgi:hypothetical protein